MAEKTVKGKCVICAKDKKGVEVADDAIIEAIRGFKKKLRVATGNKLVVCRECVPEQEKRRKKFEQSLVTNGGFGIVIAVVLGLLGGLTGVLYGLLITVFLLFFALLVYWPSLKK